MKRKHDFMDARNACEERIKKKKKFFQVFIFIKNKENFYRTCHENACK